MIIIKVQIQIVISKCQYFQIAYQTKGKLFPAIVKPTKIDENVWIVEHMISQKFLVLIAWFCSFQVIAINTTA